MPGMATGCMLVFILLMGEFLIPAFLGGGKGLLHRQRTGRFIPAIAQLAFRFGSLDRAGYDYAGYRQFLHANDPKKQDRS